MQLASIHRGLYELHCLHLAKKNHFPEDSEACLIACLVTHDEHQQPWGHARTCSSCPIMSVGSQPMYSPLRMKRSASTTLRAAANVSETASSAVVSVKTPAKVMSPCLTAFLTQGNRAP